MSCRCSGSLENPTGGVGHTDRDILSSRIDPPFQAGDSGKRQLLPAVGQAARARDELPSGCLKPRCQAVVLVDCFQRLVTTAPFVTITFVFIDRVQRALRIAQFFQTRLADGLHASHRPADHFSRRFNMVTKLPASASKAVVRVAEKLRCAQVE